MSSFIYQININFKRIILRNKRFFFFDVMLPIIFYILYSKIFVSSRMPKAALNIWQTNYLVSMIIYGCLLGSTITVANTLLEEHISHFELLTKITPLPRWKYYLSRILIFLLLNLIASIGICITGLLVNHLTLPIQTWALIILITLVGTIPLIFIGIMISMSGSPATVNLLNNIVTFPLAIVGGLWFPIAAMPQWFQTISKLTPTFELSSIDKTVLYNKTPDNQSIFGIVVWLILLSVSTLLIVKYQKHKELDFE